MQSLHDQLDRTIVRSRAHLSNRGGSTSENFQKENEIVIGRNDIDAGRRDQVLSDSRSRIWLLEIVSARLISFALVCYNWSRRDSWSPPFFWSRKCDLAFSQPITEYEFSFFSTIVPIPANLWCRVNVCGTRFRHDSTFGPGLDSCSSLPPFRAHLNIRS